ncbi:MAG TPA: 3-oxoacyl-[acyl-carrier-protein] synthase III C-terminal domain-containing protein [Frankiaceae bacterium]|nr:3-oxoacyl-[acyl-carrier-protein] synthase III C-terminal domain-containing protein [Frankiaceae bacterium]
MSRSALRLADTAAERCLRRGASEAAELDILINAGIYRDKNLGEPALAALIQEDIHANLGHPPGVGHGTFSFDVGNGACGVLSALQLLRGFLSSGAGELGMVVASDASPQPWPRGLIPQQRFPYRAAGGAVLVGWDDKVPGLTAFRSRTFPEYASLCEGWTEWRRRPRLFPSSPGGRNELRIVRRPGYEARAVDCAVDVIEDLFYEVDLSAGDVDLLVASLSADFGDALAGRIGLPEGRVVNVPEQFAGSHTAQIIAGLEQAERSGRLADSRTCLLVSAGSGITATAALYQQ